MAIDEKDKVHCGLSGHSYYSSVRRKKWNERKELQTRKMRQFKGEIRRTIQFFMDAIVSMSFGVAAISGNLQFFERTLCGIM
ncbi:hypothetical protein KIN20_016275 [Parelaphostrongylus tenuis]|uniref:Uncharacterized protein n=1 Tax=Parelaphostrongylus tenuis TaxID=148309 RepID=A0AAD5N537_PARTN|nr:hypothetical protein KIN20_016275 [Parelaphostrongylus tenuis]